MDNTIQRLKAWYFRTFLPFEDPAHPLNTTEQTFCDEISDWVDSEIEGIGPKYAREPFSKPTQYERWGSKWYRKG